MQFTAHLEDAGPSEDHQCEVRRAPRAVTGRYAQRAGAAKSQSQKWRAQTELTRTRRTRTRTQACSTPMASGFSAMCRTCTRFQCLSCCRGPQQQGVVCGACSSAMCVQCVASSPSIAAQARFWVRLGMQYASPGSALCLACSHHRTGVEATPCTPLPAKHTLADEPQPSQGASQHSLEGQAPAAPHTMQPRLTKRPRFSHT